MKKTVFVVVAICSILLGGIFIVGFLQKQTTETNPSSSSSAPSQTSSSQSTNNPTDTTEPTKTYTVAEVAKHANENNCWLIISNKVYDVSKFIPEHPGGVSQIIPFCGKEATKAFDTQGGRGRPHSPSADEMLKDYYIGNLSS